MVMSEQKIIGYRDLTEEEIDLVNEGKQLEVAYLAFINKCAEQRVYNQRMLSIAVTNVEQASMWLTKTLTRIPLRNLK